MDVPCSHRGINVVTGKITCQAAAVTQHSVTLTWNASTGATSYNVYRGTVTGGPYTKVNTAAVQALIWYDYGITTGQTYFWVVTAVNANGESSYSNEATGTIP